jgi:predicted nucleotidyltransferase
MPYLFDRIREALEVHPAVRSVTLSGSRARGDATPYSDWDVEVVTSDFDALASALPSLVAPLDPIVRLWVRLVADQCFICILPGPVKVDIIMDVPHELEPPYEVDASTLPHIESHFWDWTLWLTSKQAKGNYELLAGELEKVYGYILRPMGVERVPPDLIEAVDAYVVARDHHEARFGVSIDRRLASEVEPVVRRVAGA